MGIFARKSPIIGLEIGEQNMVLAEIKRSGNTYEIMKFGIVPTPQGIMEGKMIVNEQGVIETLKKLAQNAKVGSYRVALAVPGENTFVRNLVVPVMPESELAEAVKIETEAQLPIPGKEVTVDFIKHNVIIDGNSKKQEILAVAVKNEVISRMVRIVEAAGFRPVIMDIEPMVLHRAVKMLNKSSIPEQGGLCLVNVGAGSTNISVFEQDQLYFNRTLGFGYFKLSMSLVNQFNIPLETAEDEIAATDFEAVINRNEESVPNSRSQALILRVEGLASEIRRSVEYYISQHHGRQVSKVIITGMGSKLKGMAPYMQNILELPVEIFNPAENLQISSEAKNMEMDIVNTGVALTQLVGLALSEAK